MRHDAIRFETYAPPPPPDPARMDVACFIGHIAPRGDAVLPEALLDDLAQAFGQSRASLAMPGGLVNRPVPVTSVAGFEAIFDTDARLERRATIDGGPLAAALPGSGVPDTLAIVIDGVIREVDLRPLPLTPQEAADRIVAAGLGLDVSLQSGPGGAFLRLALPAARGAGTLAVLPCPTLGFPETRRARTRPLPSPMTLAVRQFFAMGGRKAVVVGMGAAPPYDCPRAERMAALQRLFVAAPPPAVPDMLSVINALSGALPSPAAAPETRHGPAHLHGLPEVTFVLFPDLPELVAPPPGVAAQREPGPQPDAVFAECLPAPTEAHDADDTPWLAPVLDATGHALWTVALRHGLDILRADVRDTLLVAALPRAAASLPVIEPPRSAFLQLAEGWVRSTASATAPQGLMAPDAVLAGHLARLALTSGTFVSAATLPLAPLRDIERRAARTTAPSCRLLADRHGLHLQSDLTTSDDPAWADGPVSRIMAMLLRQARDLGQELAFEPNGPRLWGRVRDVLEGLLAAMLRAGALAGTGPGDSYTVRCDTSTMSRQDIDTGALIAEVTFRPAVPVARITVRLPLTESPGAAFGQGGPA